MEKKDISQLLVDYGVYNQSGISAIELDKKLRKLFDQEVDKAREEERKKVGKEIVNLFIGINKWMSIQPGLKLEAVTDKVLGDYVSNLLKTKEDEK